MSEREAFMKIIWENPTDHTTRLVYADWLAERGEVELEQYVRLQCHLDTLLKKPERIKAEKRSKEYLGGAFLAGYLRGLHINRAMMNAIIDHPDCDCEICTRLRLNELRKKILEKFHDCRLTPPVPNV